MVQGQHGSRRWRKQQSDVATDLRSGVEELTKIAIAMYRTRRVPAAMMATSDCKDGFASWKTDRFFKIGRIKRYRATSATLHASARKYLWILVSGGRS